MKSKSEDSRTKTIRGLQKLGITEHIVNLFKAGASLDPVLGTIASLISDYLPKQREKKLVDFAVTIAEDLKRFKTRVNGEFITTDEFAFIFEKCFKGAVENYQTEKIQAFRAILVNSVTGSELSQNEKEFFLSLVDRLSVIHIRMLWFMAQPHQYLQARSIPTTNVQGSFSQFFPRVFPDASIEFIKLIIQDLYGYGFINTDKSIFGTMTATGGFDLLGNRVTKTGDEFINFITLQN